MVLRCKLMFSLIIGQNNYLDSFGEPEICIAQFEIELYQATSIKSQHFYISLKFLFGIERIVNRGQILSKFVISGVSISNSQYPKTLISVSADK